MMMNRSDCREKCPSSEVIYSSSGTTRLYENASFLSRSLWHHHTMSRKSWTPITYLDTSAVNHRICILVVVIRETPPATKSQRKCYTTTNRRSLKTITHISSNIYRVNPWKVFRTVTHLWMHTQKSRRPCVTEGKERHYRKSYQVRTEKVIPPTNAPQKWASVHPSVPPHDCR